MTDRVICAVEELDRVVLDADREREHGRLRARRAGIPLKGEQGIRWSVDPDGLPGGVGGWWAATRRVGSALSCEGGR